MDGCINWQQPVEQSIWQLTQSACWDFTVFSGMDKNGKTPIIVHYVVNTVSVSVMSQALMGGCSGGKTSSYVVLESKVHTVCFKNESAFY